MGGGNSQTQTQDTNQTQTTNQRFNSRTRLASDELQRASEALIGSAFMSAGEPFSPNRGLTIAAFSPQEMAAMQDANTAASAFGLNTVNPDAYSYLPAPSVNEAGMRGYSTGPSYDEMLAMSISEAQRAERAALLEKFRKLGEQFFPDVDGNNRDRDRDDDDDDYGDGGGGGTSRSSWSGFQTHDPGVTYDPDTTRRMARRAGTYTPSSGAVPSGTAGPATGPFSETMLGQGFQAIGRGVSNVFGGGGDSSSGGGGK